MDRVNLIPVIEHILGISGISSEGELDTLIKAVRSSDKLKNLPVSELSKIMEEMQNTTKEPEAAA